MHQLNSLFHYNCIDVIHQIHKKKSYLISWHFDLWFLGLDNVNPCKKEADEGLQEVAARSSSRHQWCAPRQQYNAMECCNIWVNLTLTSFVFLLSCTLLYALLHLYWTLNALIQNKWYLSMFVLQTRWYSMGWRWVQLLSQVSVWKIYMNSAFTNIICLHFSLWML